MQLQLFEAELGSDGTNEAASVKRVRNQAKAWNDVENFCKPFDLEGPEEYIGIAYLILAYPV
jgi:type I restriction enzyme R subunit